MIVSGVIFIWAARHVFIRVIRRAVGRAFFPFRRISDGSPATDGGLCRESENFIIFFNKLFHLLFTTLNDVKINVTDRETDMPVFLINEYKG